MKNRLGFLEISGRRVGAAGETDVSGWGSGLEEAGCQNGALPR